MISLSSLVSSKLFWVSWALFYFVIKMKSQILKKRFLQEKYMVKRNIINNKIATVNICFDLIQHCICFFTYISKYDTFRCQFTTYFCPFCWFQRPLSSDPMDKQCNDERILCWINKELKRRQIQQKIKMTCLEWI